MGILFIGYPKPYSIYLRGTVRFGGLAPRVKGSTTGFRDEGFGFRGSGSGLSVSHYFEQYDLSQILDPNPNSHITSTSLCP